jgi:RNA polymerase sigma factor (sigma-70 family)
MKSYNVQNYVRYKTDLARATSAVEMTALKDCSRDELIIKFMPLVENIAKKFSTTYQASGVLDITDLIQFGSIGLVLAVDKIEWDNITNSSDPEKTIKSFLSKRIKGSIRRALDIHGTSMKIPENKLIQIRKDTSEDKALVATFFNSIFLSIDDLQYDDEESANYENKAHQIADKSEPYKNGLLNAYLLGLLKKYLDPRECAVLRLSYGLDGDKHSANEIANILNIEGQSAYVRVSELKKQAIQKLIDNVESDQIFDFF